MAEELKLKIERRNQIHTLIQKSLEDLLQYKVTDILDNYNKSDFEKIKTINAAIEEMNDISERFDRLLHGGKTEDELQKERDSEITKHINEVFKSSCYEKRF